MRIYNRGRNQNNANQRSDWDVQTGLSAFTMALLLIVVLLSTSSSTMLVVEGYSITTAPSRTSTVVTSSFHRSSLSPLQLEPFSTRSISGSAALSSPLFAQSHDNTDRSIGRQRHQRRRSSSLSSLLPFIFFNKILVQIFARIDPWLRHDSTNRNSTFRRFVSLPSKIKRSMTVVCVSLFLWLSAAGVLGGGGSGITGGSPFTPPAAHASTSAIASTTTATTGTTVKAPVPSKVSKLISSITDGPSLDEIVDDYVRDYMFDDDSYDPVESIYREAMHDKVSGTYPKALKEVTAEVLQGTDVMKQAAKAERESGMSVGSLLVRGTTWLQAKAGLTEAQAVTLLTGVFAVGAPAIMISAAMYVAISNKRGMNKLMKKRYGESYTTDATIKVEEDVELPDDDDDDDDE